MTEDESHEAMGAMLHRGAVEQRQGEASQDKEAATLRRLLEAQQEATMRALARADNLDKRLDDAIVVNSKLMEENGRLRAEVERLTRERDEALNELDSIYAALGTQEAEGAPDAVTSIGELLARAEAAERERDEAEAGLDRADRAIQSIAMRLGSSDEWPNQESMIGEACALVCDAAARAEAAERKVAMTIKLLRRTLAFLRGLPVDASSMILDIDAALAETEKEQ